MTNEEYMKKLKFTACQRLTDLCNSDTEFASVMRRATSNSEVEVSVDQITITFSDSGQRGINVLGYPPVHKVLKVIALAEEASSWAFVRLSED